MVLHSMNVADIVYLKESIFCLVYFVDYRKKLIEFTKRFHELMSQVSCETFCKRGVHTRLQNNR